MSLNDNVEWQLADLVDAISAEVDRAEDTLALKSYARKVSFAIKKIALDVEVTMRRAPDGRLFFRTIDPGAQSDTLLKLDFAQVLESQLAGMRRSLGDTTTSAPLSMLPGITPPEIQALNALAIFSVDDLLRYTQTSAMLAELSRKTHITETRLRLWRGLPYLLQTKPDRGPPGSIVVLEGGNFGMTRPEGAQVMFHGHEARVLEWSNTRLTVEAPPEALGPGVVFVLIQSQPTNVISWEATTVDLCVDGLQVDVAQAVADEPIPVEAVLLNRGSSTSPPFSVQWFVDETPQPKQPHGPLSPGHPSSESCTRRQFVLPAGRHMLRFEVHPEADMPGTDPAGLSFSRLLEVRPLRSLVLGDFRTLSTLDPLLAGPMDPSSVLGLVFRGLGRPGGPNGEPIPDLAESWTTPAPLDVDGTRLYKLTVRLRAGVRFHNGAPLTAEDVRFTFQLLRELNSPWQSRARRIRDITLQEQQLTFLMESPDALSPLLFVGIVPQFTYEADPTGFGLRPVGCGPYQVKCIGPEKLELHAFRDFFRGAPRLERLTVVTVPDLDRLGERVEQQELPVAVLPYDEAWYERLRDLGQWQVTPVPASAPTLLHVQAPSLRERDPTRPDIHWNAHLWYVQE